MVKAALAKARSSERAAFERESRAREAALPDRAELAAVFVVGVIGVRVELDRPAAPGGGEADAFDVAEGGDEERVEAADDVAEADAELGRIADSGA